MSLQPRSLPNGKTSIELSSLASPQMLQHRQNKSSHEIFNPAIFVWLRLQLLQIIRIFMK